MTDASFSGLATGPEPAHTIVMLLVVSDFSVERGIFSYGTANPNNIYIYSTTVTTARIIRDGLNVASTAATSLTAGVPYIIGNIASSRIYTGTGSGTNTYTALYLNGSFSGNVGAISTMNVPSTTVYLGNKFDASRSFTGRMYEVLYYSGSLSHYQVQTIGAYLRGKYTAWDPTGLSTLPAVSRLDYYQRLMPRVPMKPFHPIEMSGISNSNYTTQPSLLLWLDASDSRTITTSGSLITQWRDKSGAQNHLTPVGIYGNASVQSAFQNGLNVVNFTGNNIYRSSTGVAPYPHDVYMVVALKSLVRTDLMGIGSTVADNFNSLTFGEYTSLRWHNGSSNFNRTPLTVAPSNETSTSFLLMNWRLMNNNFVLRRNGVQLSQTSSYTFTASNQTFQLGFRQTFSTAPDIQCNAYFAEILVFNCLLFDAPRTQIEQYLASKWGLTGSFSWVTPLYRQVLPRFTPRILHQSTGSPCTLWLDAADPSTITLASGLVSRWTDKSGYRVTAEQFFQNTVSSQPSYTNNTVVTNGSPRFLRSTLTMASFFGNSTNKTVFYVGTGIVGTSTTVGSSLMFGSYASSTSYWGFWASTSGLIGHYNRTSAGGTQATASGLTLPGSFLLTAKLYFVTNPEFSISINGGTPVTGSSPGATATQTAVMYLGRGVSYCVAGHQEIIAFDGQLTKSQIQTVEGYLAWKWGLRSKLPSTHAYYAYVPGE
jgi:hypothetical protein